MAHNEVLAAKFQKDLNGGISALVLLSILDRGARPMYGYQIAKSLEGTRGLPGVKQGTLYPALRQLESQGLLASEVEPSVAGPPRRYYTITEPGRGALADWRNVWTRTREFVDGVLSGTIPAEAPGETDTAAGQAAEGGDHA